MSLQMDSRGLLLEDGDEWHTTRISLPPEVQLHTLHTHQTFFVKASGRGSRSVSPEAIMSALVAKGYIPIEVAAKPNIDWYMEEETGNRCFVVKTGLDQVLNATDGAELYIAMSGPNFPAGHTVRIDITHSSSKENTFRLEYLPYLAEESHVAYIASTFCDAISAKRDLNRKDVWWVKTSTPLEELPHWVVAEKLVNNVQQNRLLVSVKDRDVQCFYCRETLHWTNQCKDKKTRDKEERQRLVERRKNERQQQIQEAKDREEEEAEWERRRNQYPDSQDSEDDSDNSPAPERCGFPPYVPPVVNHPDTPNQAHAHAGNGTGRPQTPNRDLSPEADCSHHSAPRTANNSADLSQTNARFEHMSPNSAQLDPEYPPSISSGSPPSAQPPRRYRKQAVPQQKEEENAVFLEVSWQQEIIDALSPKTRMREVHRKLNRDMAERERRKAEVMKAEIKERDIIEKKQDASRKKQLANESKQKQDALKKKEHRAHTKRVERDDHVAMNEAIEQRRLSDESQTRASPNATRSSIATALFKEMDETHKTPSKLPVTNGHSDQLPIIDGRVTDPKLTDESTGEREDRGPSLTSTPRPSSRPNSCREHDPKQPHTTPKAPVPFSYTPNTPKISDDEPGAAGTAQGLPKTPPRTPPLQDEEASKESLLDFFSSDPKSGLSQIMNLVTSPKPGQKRANNNSTSHDDSKRPFTENSSLAWQDESLRLESDRTSKPKLDKHNNQTLSTDISSIKHP